MQRRRSHCRVVRIARVAVEVTGGGEGLSGGSSMAVVVMAREESSPPRGVA